LRIYIRAREEKTSNRKNQLVVLMSEDKPSALTCFNNMDNSNAICSNCNLSIETKALEPCEEMYFENRKKRPQERRKKKPKKEKRNPIGPVWNIAHARSCGLIHLFDDN
jgi:hypothetical protein